jgi:signal peptidase I
MSNTTTQVKGKQEKKKKSVLREWFDAIVFAVVAATLIRWIFLEAFTIPTPSMEKSLLVGDFLFVSKFHYGARTPKTILQIPLTHQKIWGTEIPSYSTLIQLPQYRLPGFSSVKKGDCVVFNWPADFSYPTDLKTNYIKRCVGTAGDTISIVKHVVYINGVAEKAPEKLQYRYLLETDQVVNERIFKKHDITDYYPIPGGYLIFTMPSTAEKLATYDFVKSITQADAPEGEPNPRVYPYDENLNWNEDNYGPVYIPRKGDVVPITASNINYYTPMIKNFEGHDKVEAKNGKLFINDVETPKYTFKQNYYFMMGDNRHNSEDSRFWGLVPEDHIVGKAWMIWLSKDPNSKFFIDGIRWKRLFNLI